MKNRVLLTGGAGYIGSHTYVAAVKSLLQNGESFTVNIGTGQGYSVLEVVRAFEQASGQLVPYRFVARRPGDVWHSVTLMRRLPHAYLDGAPYIH